MTLPKHEVLTILPAMRYTVWLLSFTLCLSSARAFRTAYFPEVYKNQTLIWVDQKEFFNNETLEESQRPIWIHAGDSISSGWAGSTMLSNVLSKFEKNEPVPSPASLEFFRSLLPDPKKTWYAGTHQRVGLLGKLEEMTGATWVVYSTALAGAFMSSLDRNPLLLIDSMPAHLRTRVRLITLSLGNNDLCDSVNPFEMNPEFEYKSTRILNSFPNAARVALKPIHPNALRQVLFNRLEKIKDKTVREAMKRHCEISLRINCARPEAAKVSRIKPLIDEYLERNFGQNLVDLAEIVKDDDFLTVAAADCFHPSSRLQKIIADHIYEKIK